MLYCNTTKVLITLKRLYQTISTLTISNYKFKQLLGRGWNTYKIYSFKIYTRNFCIFIGFISLFCADGLFEGKPVHSRLSNVPMLFSTLSTVLTFPIGISRSIPSTFAYRLLSNCLRLTLAVTC